MKKRVIKVSLNEQSIDRAIKELDNYKKWLVDKTKEFLKALADEGVQIASAKFAKAVYDGTNDVSCSVEERGENKIAVVAVGSATLFIEFGTGVKYPDNHPEAAEHGMRRGEYGAGHGKQQTWGYYGEAGTNGVEFTKPNGNTVVLTHGNPANMSMYETVKHLEGILPRLAQEVFR